ncbi:MAG: hypothetical protein ABI745_16245 [Caldimonas sp.]
MPSIDLAITIRRRRVLRRVVYLGVAVLMAGCTGPSVDRAPGDSVVPGAQRNPPAATPSGVPKDLGSTPLSEPRKGLPAPATSRNWEQVRHQAAERLVAANPDITYMGRVPDQLLAIPVLEIELNSDGSVRRIEILREPRQHKDTLKIAVDAVRRAAPYGDVSRLPRPWKFVETFLFDDDRRFKPRTLDR